MAQTLAPILLFTYNRPEHTKQTLASLRQCRLIEQSELHVFCDAAKDEASQADIENLVEVRRLVEAIDFCRKVSVHYRKKNFGLFKNITTGVADIIVKSDRVIVLEDDLLVSRGFLEYMNTALEKYAENKRVQQISAFMFPLPLAKDNSSLFMPVTNTIGWGTWRDRWEQIDFEPDDADVLTSNHSLRRAFDLDSSYPYADMLMRQLRNERTGSWAILYWWHTFKSGGLVLYPDYALVQHNDFDQSGVHSGDTSFYDQANWDSDYSVLHYPEFVDVSENAFRQLKRHLKGKLVFRIKYYLNILRLIILYKFKI